MKNHLFAITIAILSVGILSDVNAQCGSWVGQSFQSDAESAHSIYRQALKVDDMEIAFENWKKAYELAPAADGKRDYHFTDGVELYKKKFAGSTDEATKAEYSATIMRLYDEAIACYLNKSITLKTDTEEALNNRVGYLYGRKAYDMFYTLNTGYDQTTAALDNCIKYAGDNAEYIIFDPYARIIVWEFKEGRMPKEKAVELFKRLHQIGEYNIANNEGLSEGYQQAVASMDGIFTEIEGQIFDCDYFKEKLLPEYEENRDDPQVLKRVLVTLKTQGCLDTDPVIVKLDAEWKQYATIENARLLAEYEANNPAAAAKAAYDAGKFQEAISKYKQAIADETDDDKKATMMFAVASIEFRKLNLYSQAKSTALSAARLKPGWGRPYMLIGDMYGKTARSCGDGWNQRLAILAAMDKYSYAKSIDSSVADEANDRLSNYYGSLPEKSEGFMRGVSEGQSASVGCWIGETVKLRFK
jgi:tetratricopeptide (TPR) repeat protein